MNRALLRARLLALGNLPSQVLQEALHPGSGLDWAVTVTTSAYMVRLQAATTAAGRGALTVGA